MEHLTLSEIKIKYPEQWVLIGEPEIFEPEINDILINKLISGFVLYASKDKREIGYKAKEVTVGINKTVCLFTGEVPKHKFYLL
jgi:hypothetical protein